MVVVAWSYELSGDPLLGSIFDRGFKWGLSVEAEPFNRVYLCMQMCYVYNTCVCVYTYIYIYKYIYIYIYIHMHVIV